MRFMCRGADIDGNVANFVETEQILTINRGDGIDIYSHMQIRGSIPFFWAQKPSIKYAPKTVLEANQQKDTLAFTKHMDQMMKEYGNVMMANLIDNKPGSGQQKLGVRFND